MDWKHTGRTGLLDGKRADAVYDAGYRSSAFTNAKPHGHDDASKRTICRARRIEKDARPAAKKRRTEAQTPVKDQGGSAEGDKDDGAVADA